MEQNNMQTDITVGATPVQPQVMPASSSYNLAESTTRVLSALIDWVVIFIIFMVFSIPLNTLNTAATSSALNNGADLAALLQQSQSSSALGYVVYFLMIVISFVYFVIVPAKVFPGQTLGKYLLKIRIAKAQSGTTADLGDLVKRHVVSVLLWVPCVGFFVCCIGLIIQIVNIIMLFSDAKRQTVYDKLASTVVIDAK